MDYQTVLKNLNPCHEFFIGIDSDGCVFDSMEVKQKEFFIPIALKYFNLYGISKLLRETWEFVNLYSIHRGGNRFTSILHVFELLNQRPEIRKSAIVLPELKLLREWTETETKLSNFNLRKYFESNRDAGIEKVLNWSEAVNKEIAEWLSNIPPFPAAKLAIQEISSIADIVIVSQTPLEALEREWEEHKLINFVNATAGQEHGTKTEHIELAATGKYPNNKILMIGDAIGDLNAAKNNGILFYPIIPGNENKSWERFLNESLGKFTSGSYGGNYESELIKEFRNILPEYPKWRQ
jgi:phosphoglycolate phosphatase-like HAD superfamily hydrolase